MFGIGAQEIVIFGLLFTVVFGPEKLSRTARELGQFVREVRRSVDEFKVVIASEEHPYGEREFEPSGAPSIERDG